MVRSTDRRDVWVGLKSIERYYERAVVRPNAEVNETNKTTPGSERRSLLKNCLTGPTLLEMSGYPTNQELSASKRRSQFFKLYLW